MILTKALIDDDVLTVRRIQDVEPILEDAKARHNAGLHGSADFKHAASLPNVLVERYCADNGITFEEFVKNPDHIRRMVNDPALAHFRVWPGRL